MPTRNVVVTEAQDRMIDALVESGRYQNASEVLRAGLRLIQRHEEDHAVRLQALRDAVQAGVDDIEAGRFVTFDDAESLDRHLRSITDPIIERGRSR
ncbi:MAG: type II toxin-antitoxin system ParD family antitoxin [Alphaproteobacteria bacterium]